jgi:serine protease
MIQNTYLHAICPSPRVSLTTLSIGLALVVNFDGASFAQDNKAPFTPEQGRSFLNDAAEKAIEKQRKITKTFEEFKQGVTKEPFQDGKYIVNGDTPISTAADLEKFYNETVAASPAAHELRAAIRGTTEFAILHKDGKDIVWDTCASTSTTACKERISYCVSSTGFGPRYNTVVTAMADATRAWEEVADVHFIHLGQEDLNCTASNNNVVFDVRPVNFNQYLARSFFPKEDRSQTNVLIDHSSFELPSGGRLSLTGILRHELGHTLGARHEHTRPESGTCFEDQDWRGVTNYDALSVMHYPQCNGKGDWSLTLTLLDKNGMACIYGPTSGFNIDLNVCTPR